MCLYTIGSQCVQKLPPLSQVTHWGWEVWESSQLTVLAGMNSLLMYPPLLVLPLREQAFAQGYQDGRQMARTAAQCSRVDHSGREDTVDSLLNGHNKRPLRSPTPDRKRLARSPTPEKKRQARSPTPESTRMARYVCFSVALWLFFLSRIKPRISLNLFQLYRVVVIILLHAPPELSL